MKLSSIAWRVETATDTLNYLTRAWEDLRTATGPACAMASPDWAKAWWTAFSSGLQPFVLVAEDHNGVPAGILPFARCTKRHRGFSLKTISLFENGSTPVAAVPAVTRPSILRDGLGWLLEHEREWDLLALRRIPGESLLFLELTNLLHESGRRHVKRLSLSSPVLRITTDWHTWLSKRSTKFRKTLRNQLNRVDRLPEHSVQEFHGRGALNAVWPEYEAVCDRTWKRDAGAGLSASPEKRVFLRGLVDSFDGGEGLVLWALRASDQIIAAELHLRDACGTHALRGDYDDAYESYSPGSALEANIIQASFDRGYDLHDFCGNAYPYKLRWSEDVRERYDFLIFSRRLLPAFVGLIEENLTPRVRVIRDYWRRRSGGRT